jgi:hypothetical protein
MRCLLRLSAMLLVSVSLWFGAAQAAQAESGSFITNDGLTCSYSGSGSMYTVYCSGFSHKAGGYVSYNCDYMILGSSASWTCRDMHGNSWRGSK